MRKEAQLPTPDASPAQASSIPAPVATNRATIDLGLITISLEDHHTHRTLAVGLIKARMDALSGASKLTLPRKLNLEIDSTAESDIGASHTIAALNTALQQVVMNSNAGYARKLQALGSILTRIIKNPHYNPLYQEIRNPDHQPGEPEWIGRIRSADTYKKHLLGVGAD